MQTIKKKSLATSILLLSIIEFIAGGSLVIVRGVSPKRKLMLILIFAFSISLLPGRLFS